MRAAESEGDTMFYGLMRDSAVIGTYRYAKGKAKRTARKSRAKARRSVPEQGPKAGPLYHTEAVVWVED